jgi:hypothetical protein
MNFKHFLAESHEAPKYLRSGSFADRERAFALHKYMVLNGFKFLGSGVEKAAYVDSSSTKIILYKNNPASFSTFTRWIDFCKQHKNNPHLPNIKLDHPLKIGGEDGTKHVFQVATIERLFSIDSSSIVSIGFALTEIADLCETSRALSSGKNKPRDELIAEIKSSLEKFGSNDEFENDAHSLLLLSVEDIDSLIGTIIDIIDFSPSNSILDLHPGNFMLGEDGTIVITDPWA